MDNADRATDADFNAAALAAYLETRPPFDAPSAAVCQHCDEPIPAARRQAVPGVQYCTYCQTILERHRGTV